MTTSELTSNDSRSAQAENNSTSNRWGERQRRYGQWWRAYNDCVDNPKIQSLPPPLFKFWFNLLCVASENGGVIPPLSQLKSRLKARLDLVESHLKALLSRGLIDEIDGRLEPHNWRKRQYKSDFSTPRVQAHRNAKRNVSETASETVPETDTDRKKERKKDNIPEPASAASGGNGKIYAFENGVVKLLSKDLDRWQKTFTEINVTAELEAASPWLNQQGTNWFHAASGLLGKRNREAKTKKDSLLAPPPKPVRPGRTQWSNF